MQKQIAKKEKQAPSAYTFIVFLKKNVLSFLYRYIELSKAITQTLS